MYKVTLFSGANCRVAMLAIILFLRYCQTALVHIVLTLPLRLQFHPHETFGEASDVTVRSTVVDKFTASDNFMFYYHNVILFSAGVPIYWIYSSVSVSEGLSGDPHLAVYRDLQTTEAVAQQTVDVAVVGGT